MVEENCGKSTFYSIQFHIVCVSICVWSIYAKGEEKFECGIKRKLNRENLKNMEKRRKKLQLNEMELNEKVRKLIITSL